MDDRRQLCKVCKLIGIVFLINSVVYLAQYAYDVWHIFRFSVEHPDVLMDPPFFTHHFGVPAAIHAACFAVFFFGANKIAGIMTQGEKTEES